MSLMANIPWGFVERGPQAFEWRVDYTGEDGAIYNETLTFDHTPTGEEVEVAVEARRVALEERLANPMAEPEIPGQVQDSPIEAQFKAERDAFKVAAIGYVHSHPAGTLEEVLDYAQPLAPMINGEVLIMTYATNSYEAGYIPSASFEAFRAFVCALTLEQLMAF